MPRLLLLLLALGACARPAAVAPPRASADQSASAFDAQAWLARARAVDTGGINMADDPRMATVRPVTDELSTAVDWNRACDERWDAGEQRMTTDVNPTGYLRGLYGLHDLGAGQTLVTVLCDFGANTGRYAYVHLDGRRAALLTGTSVGPDAVVVGPPVATHDAQPAVTGPGTFTVTEFSRGIGGCGSFASYRVTDLGTTSLAEARGLTCAEADANLDAYDDGPMSWPIIGPE